MKREAIGRSGEMEVFANVVSRGSLSAAARDVGLSPSAVSRVIARLEERLGTRLLVRTTRAIALTPEGEDYHRAALRILRDLDESERQIADQGAPRGRLRVSSTQAHGRLVLIPLLKEFLTLYPDIKIDLSLTDTRIDLVEERADVAIRVGPLADSGLTARRLGASARVIVASPDYLKAHGTPQIPEDLLHHNIIGFNFRRANPNWPFIRDGQPFTLEPTGNIEVNNGDTMVQLMREGIGIGRVGTFNVARHLADGSLVEILKDYNPGDEEPINALFVGGANIPARVRVFIDYLAEKLG